MEKKWQKNDSDSKISISCTLPKAIKQSKQNKTKGERGKKKCPGAKSFFLGLTSAV